MLRLQHSHITFSCSLIAFAGGAAGLLGWMVEGDGASLSLFSFCTSDPATASGVLLAAIGLSRLPRVAAGANRSRLAALCGSAALLAAVLGILTSVRELQSQTQLQDLSCLGSGLTSVTLGLIGAALIGVEWKVGARLWWAECLAVTTAIISLVPLVGYGYGGTALVPAGAAVMLLALATGVLFAYPNRGIMGVIFSSGLGGIIARRTLPAAILIPSLLGWLRLLGQRWQLYGTEVGSTLLVVATIVMFCGVAIWVASLLNRLDREREVASESLRQRNQQIYDLYSRSPCGYHSLDEHGVFQSINDTELEWLGCERDEVIGKARFADFVTADTRHIFAANFEKFKKQGSVTGLEFSLLTEDGRVLPVLLNATAIYDAEGNYLASRSTLFDATELKRAEQKGRQLHAELEKRVKERTAELARSNAELIQKNQENAMFVYGVSHDLRSPLVNLEGFSSELSMVCNELREMISEGDLSSEFRNRSLAIIDDDMSQSVRFIQTAVHRLSNIIDALLRLSRAGRVEYQCQMVDVGEIVSRIVEAMGASIEERAAAITVGDLPPAFGDPTAIEQAFANLIGNAVNYLHPDRCGRIEVGSMAAEPAPDGDDAGEDAPLLQVYYVKDNGRGIPESCRAKVFQALKRLHPEAAKGEGIGLALVRRIIERHGGKIWFASKEGIGTEFCFTLPLHVAEANPKAAPMLSIPSTDRDDRLGNVEMIAQLSGRS